MMNNKKYSRLYSGLLLAGAGLSLSFLAQVSMADTKDYLVTAARPDKVIVVDVEAREVYKTHTIPNTAQGSSVAGITVSRDGKVAYMVHNRWETVSGIDLESGEEVFRAELSSPGIRGKAHFAIDVSPDGKELAVHVNPTRLKLAEYEVLDTYIAIFDTSDGIGAVPIRKLDAPRRTTTLAYSPDYKRLYAFSWDMHVLDPQTGEQIGLHPWKSWKRKGYGEPDSLSVSPQFEQANEFASPYFINYTDENGETSIKTGIWSLDLAKDTVRFSEFDAPVVMPFSTVINPVRRNEAYTAYTQLTKTDMDTGEMVKRIDLDRTFYTVQVSSDGEELYVGGTVNEIAIYDSETLESKGKITISEGDQVLSSLRMVQR